MSLFLLLPFLSLIGFSLQLAQFAKVRWTLAIPSTLSLIIILLYIATPFKMLYQATWFIYLGGTSALIFYIFLNRHRAVAEIKDNYREIITFFGICILYTLYAQDKNFYLWDDFSHWGIVSLELLEKNLFESQGMPTAILNWHAHYPRGSALYHYFILMPIGHSEAGALSAHFLLHLIFIAPLWHNKKVWQSLMLSSSVLLVIALYTLGLITTYNDSTIGVIFGSIIAINILEANKIKAMLVSLPILILLPLYREIGLILAIFSAIILILNCLRDKKISDISVSYWLLFCLMLVLPITANFMWMSYFKSTHDFFGRIEHSFGNLVILAKSFNQEHKLLLIAYTKFILQFLMERGSPVIYFLIVLSWYGVNKYRKDLKADYKFFIISSGVCFILFCLWRLYLYFFTFSYAEAINGASLLRYIGSYCIIFTFTSCAYIKRSFFEIRYNNFELAIFIIFLILSSTAIAYRISTMHNKLDVHTKDFYKQSSIVKEFLSRGYDVGINFENKAGDMDCHILNYKLSPYLSKSFLEKCFAAPSSLRNLDNENRNTLIINYDFANFSKDRCKIFYSPFINKLKIICSE